MTRPLTKREQVGLMNCARTLYSYHVISSDWLETTEWRIKGSVFVYR